MTEPTIAELCARILVAALAVTGLAFAVGAAW